MHSDEGRAADATEELAAMEFEDGRVVLYDPTNPEAWLIADGQ